MQIDIDYCVGEGSKADLRIFGITEEGCSVMATVTGFKPYFWAHAPENMPLNATNLETIRTELNVRFM